jgi:hypothetical protein
MKLIVEDRPPETLFLFRKSVPSEEGGEIGQRRRVLRRYPEGEVVEEVQVHEMVLMPVAEPDHLHTLFGSEPDESFPIGSRIDEDTGPLDIDRIAVRITTPVFTGKKADRSYYLLFHRNFHKKDKWVRIPLDVLMYYRSGN